MISPRVWAVKQLSYFTLLHTTHNTQHIIQQSNDGVHTHTHFSFYLFLPFSLFFSSQDSPFFPLLWFTEGTCLGRSRSPLRVRCDYCVIGSEYMYVHATTQIDKRCIRRTLLQMSLPIFCTLQYALERLFFVRPAAVYILYWWVCVYTHTHTHTHHYIDSVKSSR
jgi:hypothetical protein